MAHDTTPTAGLCVLDAGAGATAKNARIPAASNQGNAMRLFHFLPRKYVLPAIEQRRFKVARISELNDPFEFLCADFRDPRARKSFREFKKLASSKFGFICLARHWHNPLLWSHYADKHLGAALEVEISEEAAMPVKYTETRIRWDPRKIMLAGGFSQDHAEVIATTKSHHWSYEEEVRVAIQLDQAESQDGLYFSSVAIKGIVIGPLSDISTEEIQAALPKAWSVAVTRTRLAFRSFNVIRRKDKPIEIVRG